MLVIRSKHFVQSIKFKKSIKMCTNYDEINQIWSNSFHEYSIDSEMPLSLLKSLSSHGSKVAQINDDTGTKMTFHELRLNTIRIAQNLQKRGYQSRQVVGFISDRISDHLTSAILATFCLACPIAPVHQTMSNKEIIRVLEKTKPGVIFCADNAYGNIYRALSELNFDVEIFILGQPINGLQTVESLLTETGNENNFVPIKYDAENDVAGLFCSSGTTGPSKLIQISYAHHGLQPPLFGDKNEDNVVLCFESIYWLLGVYNVIDVLARGTTRIISSASYSLELLLKLIDKYRVTTLYETPYDLTALLKSDAIHNTDLLSVKTIYMYGCKASNDLVVKIKSYFRNANCISWFGMTEVGKITTSSFKYEVDLNVGSLLDGFAAKIVDYNGISCGPNTSGELCVKTKFKFLGYLDDPAANEAAVDNEGFFHTGDIGYFDENGLFVIGDRKKSIIVVYYFDGVVLPADIEIFIASMPEVLHACVVGIPIEGNASLPAALIVPKSNSKLTESDVYNAIAEHFPDRAKLRGGVYFVQSIPRTPTGKVRRAEVTVQAAKLFKVAKENNADVQSYLSEISDEFRKLI